MAMDPKKKPQDDAFAAGQATRTGLQVAPKIPGLLAEMTGAPAAVRSAGNAIGNFARGLAGAAPTAPAATLPAPSKPAAAAPLPTPSLATPPPTVAPAPVVPARNPASPAPSAGAAAPAGGVPAPIPAPAIKTIDGRPNGVASSVNAQGNNVYDNASIAKLNERMGQAGGGVAAQSFGGTAPTMTAAPVASIPRPSLAAPSQGGAIGAVIGNGSTPEQERVAALGDLNRQIEGIGNANTRGKRDLLANLLQLRTGLTQQAGDLAGRADANQLDASTRMATTQMGEQGANQRAELSDTGQTDRTLLGERGANARAELSQAGDNFRAMNRPEYMPDKDGNVTLVSGGIARPVTDAKGKGLSVVTDQQQKAGERAQTVLDAIGKQAVEFLPVGQQPSAEQIGLARLQAAQVQGLQTATGPNGERGVIINGELVPL